MGFVVCKLTVSVYSALCIGILIFELCVFRVKVGNYGLYHICQLLSVNQIENSAHGAVFGGVNFIGKLNLNCISAVKLGIKLILINIFFRKRGNIGLARYRYCVLGGYAFNYEFCVVGERIVKDKGPCDFVYQIIDLRRVVAA